MEHNRTVKHSNAIYLHSFLSIYNDKFIDLSISDLEEGASRDRKAI